MFRSIQLCRESMATMSILFSIPSSLHIELLSKWLMFRDAVHIDSAVCCSKYRLEWLSALSSPNCDIDTGKRIRFRRYVKMIPSEWLISRKLRSSYLYCAAGLLNDDGKRVGLLKTCGESVKHLRLDLCGVQFKEEIVVDILKYCPKCERVDVRDAVLNEVFVLFIGYCKELEMFDCHRIDSSIIHACISSVKLQHLKIDSYGYGPINQQCLPKSLPVNTTCRSLDLAPALCSRVKSEIAFFVGRFTHLRRLHVTLAKVEHLVEISKHCRLVHEADVIMPALNCRDANIIAQNWQNVQDLQLFNADRRPKALMCDEAVCDLLVRCCPMLRVLNLTSRLPSPEDIRLLDPAAADIAALNPAEGSSHLQRLYVPCLFASTLKYLAQNCPHLTCLCIMHPAENSPAGHAATSTSISTSTSNTTSTGSAQSSLHLLSLTRVKSVTLKHCRVQALDLQRGLQGRTVQVLGLQCVHGLSDDTVLQLLQLCPQLRAVSLLGCSSVSPAVVPAVLAAYPQLTTLEYCNATNRRRLESGDDEAYTADLRKQYPHVNTLRVVT